MTIQARRYISYVNEPWGKMFYGILWDQLEFSRTGLKILDFGSGLGITANYLAAMHDVSAIEPDAQLLRYANQDFEYKQYRGGINNLKRFNDNHFDMILCHNVLEYILQGREAVFSELWRVLKKGGRFSLVVNNPNGEIMQRAIYQMKPSSAAKLLNSETIKTSVTNGTMRYVDVAKLFAPFQAEMEPARIYGIRSFYGLSQNDDAKHDQTWYEQMLDLEINAAENPVFREIAFFKHYLVEKKIEQASSID